ncbi:hypothetical protein LN42_07155 [Marinitoga sp. 1137]|uniref:hypothetical protein n=1 Tax=Marinitoga sp. 1137 TaxID=1545835 RepID=UPI0009509E4F|nr:hypothetical protein [Marinitoga sp. 1137]APT76187.1 hypothetical protein LN42_07155 [Marinitoga sp. 1137]
MCYNYSMKRNKILIFIILILQINIFSYVKEIEIKDLSYSFFEEYIYPINIQGFKIEYIKLPEFNINANLKQLKYLNLKIKNISDKYTKLNNYINPFQKISFDTRISINEYNDIDIQFFNESIYIIFLKIPTKYYIPQIEESLFSVKIPQINFNISKKGLFDDTWVLYFSGDLKIKNAKLYSYFGYGNENIIIDNGEKNKTEFIYIEYIEKSSKIIFNYNNFGKYYKALLKAIKTYNKINFSFNISEKLKPSISVAYTKNF